MWNVFRGIEEMLSIISGDGVILIGMMGGELIINYFKKIPVIHFIHFNNPI